MWQYWTSRIRSCNYLSDFFFLNTTALARLLLALADAIPYEKPYNTTLRICFLKGQCGGSNTITEPFNFNDFTGPVK